MMTTALTVVMLESISALINKFGFFLVIWVEIGMIGLCGIIATVIIFCRAQDERREKSCTRLPAGEVLLDF